MLVREAVDPNRSGSTLAGGPEAITRINQFHPCSKQIRGSNGRACPEKTGDSLITCVSLQAGLQFQALRERRCRPTQGCCRIAEATITDLKTRLAVTSIAVAIAVTGLKALAYYMTGSVALYSDALESIVNLTTAIAVVAALRIAAKPPDREHPFGHHKAEHIAAGLEGALIAAAAILILQEAYGAFQNPRKIEAPVAGLAVNAFAALINAGWGTILIRRGRALRSPALVADGWHLMSDVATSGGVLIGLMLAVATGWLWLDPLLAGIVAIAILYAGWHIITQSMSGLMDESATGDIMARIRQTIAERGEGALQVHDLRARAAGPVTFIEFHLVVPGEQSVSHAHEICDRLEDALREAVPGARVLIHVEPDEKAKDVGVIQIAEAGAECAVDQSMTMTSPHKS